MIEITSLNEDLKDQSKRIENVYKLIKKFEKNLKKKNG